MSNITIRTASIADAKDLTHLSATTFWESWAHENKKEDMESYMSEALNIDQITAELNDVCNTFFIAFMQDMLIGYAKMRFLHTPEQLKDKKPIEIERLYVLKTHHDKKIGAALMERCVAHAHANNHNVIWLGVWEPNEKAVNFYKRWGFEKFGAHFFKLGSDLQTDILMKKELK